nr:cytochrome P450 CYP82D47-like [Ipomoea trifida]
MDTTAITLTWALSLVLNNYSVLEKIRAELDIYVGRERHVNISDLSSFTYLHAVVKDTLRLYPAGPLLVPHESIDDCVVDGYTILKGTRLLVNAAKIHRDLNFWSDPDVFQPERFLNKHKEIDVKGMSLLSSSKLDSNPSMKSSSSLDLVFLLLLWSCSQPSSTVSISLAVSFIAFSCPPISNHLSHGSTDSKTRPSTSRRVLDSSLTMTTLRTWRQYSPYGPNPNMALLYPMISEAMDLGRPASTLSLVVAPGPGRRVGGDDRLLAMLRLLGEVSGSALCEIRCCR